MSRLYLNHFRVSVVRSIWKVVPQFHVTLVAEKDFDGYCYENSDEYSANKYNSDDEGKENSFTTTDEGDSVADPGCKYFAISSIFKDFS